MAYCSTWGACIVMYWMPRHTRIPIRYSKTPLPWMQSRWGFGFSVLIQSNSFNLKHLIFSWFSLKEQRAVWNVSGSVLLVLKVLWYIWCILWYFKIAKFWIFPNVLTSKTHGILVGPHYWRDTFKLEIFQKRYDSTCLSRSVSSWVWFN